jgi:hypothetical protein
MSLGGNLSSGYTNSLNDTAAYCEVQQQVKTIQASKCCSGYTSKSPVARLPSMLLLSKTCAPPSPANFALYPKVAVPSSIRTQSLASGTSCASVPNPISRFSQYQRYQVPVPCAPLTPLANTAGISKPSTRACNL